MVHLRFGQRWPRSSVVLSSSGNVGDVVPWSVSGSGNVGHVVPWSVSGSRDVGHVVPFEIAGVIIKALSLGPLRLVNLHREQCVQ